jgi:hypothetical protein
MSKRAPKKNKRRSKAVPALGMAGLSLSLASGATASTGEATDVPSTSQPHGLFLGEEEIFDTSLSTFFTFDKENGEQTSHAQPVWIVSPEPFGVPQSLRILRIARIIY